MRFQGYFSEFQEISAVFLGTLKRIWCGGIPRARFRGSQRFPEEFQGVSGALQGVLRVSGGV